MIKKGHVLDQTSPIDWRMGEKYFMQRLIDGDFASNNGGWQWASSTGTDSQPYFRIFNPLSQSERFDSDGKFVRKYVKELASVQGKASYDPANALSAKEFAKLGCVLFYYITRRSEQSKIVY